ncbi:MAG: PAS domain-containing protein [Alphaproteobacteria bacterium]|nr:PAS domain-containing protein [Alphaproteobacteria bacterium]
MLLTPSQSTPGDIESALAYWQRLRGPRRMPSRKDFDPLDIPDILPYVMLIDVLREPLDFRFRLLGSGHDQIVACNYKGMRFSELAHLRRGNSLWDEYERVAVEGVPLRSLVRYIGTDPSIRRIEHCLMPLSSDGELVDMIFVITAVERTGAA